MTSPDKWKEVIPRVRKVLDVSWRRICHVIGQPRAIQRYEKHQAEDKEQLREQIVNLTSKYGRYGYRRMIALLQKAGWQVNRKRVERL